MAVGSTEGAAPRAAAARAVVAVLEGRSLGVALAGSCMDIEDSADRALTHALAYGVLRDHAWLAALCDSLLQRPRQTPPAVHALVHVGLYQLRSMRVPPHAAVSATVAACALLNQNPARGVVNAVLRRYQREGRALEAALPGRPSLRYSYPDWLVDRIREDWPDAWREVLVAGNTPGPMTLRVNRRRGTRDDLRARLAKDGIGARALAAAPDALRLDEARAVDRLPGFAEGGFSVQDAAAQFAAPLLQARAGMRVLDACAAPGGKTAHLLESVDDLDLLGLDVDAVRLDRVRDTLDRLSLTAQLRCADAINPSDWWDGRPFDRILCDAPCSGTGVIRRHPDIKWLRCSADIPRLAAGQRALLDALWPLLAPGGVLLYATCSILDAEGPAVTETFLRARADASEWPIPADCGCGVAAGIGRRIPPGGHWDGFYYARLRRA